MINIYRITYRTRTFLVYMHGICVLYAICGIETYPYILYAVYNTTSLNSKQP